MLRHKRMAAMRKLRRGVAATNERLLRAENVNHVWADIRSSGRLSSLPGSAVRLRPTPRFQFRETPQTIGVKPPETQMSYARFSMRRAVNETPEMDPVGLRPATSLL